MIAMLENVLNTALCATMTQSVMNEHRVIS